MSLLIIKVFVLLPFSKTFDYICSYEVYEGDIVSINFGKIPTFGVVCGVGEVPAESKFALKEINGVVLRNIFPTKFLEFIKSASSYYAGSVGMFLRLSFPFSKFRIPEVKEEFEFCISLLEGREDSLRSILWKEVYGKLKHGETLSLSGLKIPPRELTKFVEKKLIEVHKIEPSLIKPVANLPVLSGEQEKAFSEISQSLYKGYKTIVLEGETGSGKTEVYFYLINEVLQKGGQVLLMLPEIALSGTILKRFKERFGFEATLWHSAVYEGKRVNNFLKIASGEVRVVIGTRSALFLPFKNLSLIIVDEEHDNSYKQEEVTIYHGRDMAVMRAFAFKIPVVLGSATPSIESYNNIVNGKYTLVSLKNRFFVNQMPAIRIVDMKAFKPLKGEFISPVLKSRLLEVVGGGGQALLFLNRRGYAPVVLCGTCGFKIKCKYCDVHLTEHKHEGKLKCHHCGFVSVKPEVCIECASEDEFKVLGVGVERIMEEMCKVVDPSKIALLTSDTLTSPTKTKEVLEKIQEGKASVIIGTQVVSKGYHFPNLKFVGVLDADFGLNIEDFRAFEKTFQLLYQVAGRTGRERADGEVYIQTYEPKNKVLFSIINYDKEGFYALELESRKKFKLPPFAKQIAFVISGAEKEETLEVAKLISLTLEEEFRSMEGFSMFGPTIPMISFLRGKFRFRILILSTKYFSLQEKIKQKIDSLKIKPSILVKIDVDPLSFY